MLVRKYRMDENFHAEIEGKDELKLHIQTEEFPPRFRDRFSNLLDDLNLSPVHKDIVAEQFYSAIEEVQVVQLLQKRQIR